MRKTGSLNSLSHYGIELLLIGLGFFLISYSLADFNTALSIFLAYFGLWLGAMTGSIWTKRARKRHAKSKGKSKTVFGVTRSAVTVER